LHQPGQNVDGFHYCSKTEKEKKECGAQELNLVMGGRWDPSPRAPAIGATPSTHFLTLAHALKFVF